MNLKKVLLLFLVVGLPTIRSYASAQTLESPVSIICHNGISSPSLSFVTDRGTVTPYGTCTGDGGIARINYSGGGNIAWEVNPYWARIGGLAALLYSLTKQAEQSRLSL